ncbi:MAG: phosphoglycerate kinase [Ignavibacteria bacterium]|nr:phosphoglycerate kinase [Ignavibacteria bacterium]MBI3766275.1 phosphoglycerate kinase [Ignavibacteriales bacterium]
MNKLTVDDIRLRGKRVLVRVDFNVPMENNRVSDDTRIIESLPTIKKILGDGGRAILMSHLGRPKGKRNTEFSLQPVANRLSELLHKPVKFAHDCIGHEVKTIVSHLHDGECLMLENLRFHPGEEENDQAFSKELASLGEVYVNDAFGTAHRAHASTEGITHYLHPSVAGYLMKKELDYLGRAISNPVRPYVAILGGAKISGKIDVIQNLMNVVNSLIIGGGMMFTFYKARGMEIGKSLLEENKVELAGKILHEANARGVKLLLPVDCVIAQHFDNNAPSKVVPVTDIPAGWRGLDIGPESVRLFCNELRNAKTVVWNGPMGVFEMENFASGTAAIAKELAELTKHGTTTIVGGGDSAAAMSKLGLEKAVSHVSTGGGASLEFLEGKILPGLAALGKK